jgi:Fic family protein
LSLIDTQLLIEEGITPKGKPLEHTLMVKDHYEALMFIFSVAKAETPISTELLQQINAKVMESTGGIYNTALGAVDASRGEFRKVNNFVGSRYFINYAKVPLAVKDLVKGINGAMNAHLEDEKALELSWKAHFDFVSIHPLVDGKGRTGRLLEAFIQSSYGLPVGRVFKEDKALYFQSLEETREKKTLKPFIEFMSWQYKKHLEIEIAKFEDMNEDKPKGGGYSFVF